MDRGEIYFNNMIGDLNSGTEGWIDWNMVLDHTGGPNHAGNFCDAPIIVNPDTNEVFYQSSYYYIGHFSKYINPGAKRIHCGSIHGALETAAFLNPNGAIVTILLNRTEGDQKIVLECLGKSITVTSLKHSIITLILQ